jgi:diacylglycerol kinase (ATP)
VAAARRLLLNPFATRGRHAAKRLLPLGRSLGLEIVTTGEPGEMTAQARRAVEEGLERVLVAGGDGALHHAIQALAGTDCALGIVPLGSGNDLARSLGLNLDPLRALETALSGKPRHIDLGRVEDRWFASVVGLGFDSEVNRFVRERAGWPQGRWAYPWAVVRTLSRFHPPRLSVEHEGGRWEGPAILAALANAPYFGGGMRIAPAARMDDGRLDLVIVERIAKAKLLALFPRVYAGTHVRHPRVLTLRVRGALFRADRPLTFYADGEPVIQVAAGGTRVEAHEAALAVVSPPGAGG